MKYQNIREEELKNKIAQDYFWIHDCSKIIGNVDFCVCPHQSGKALSEQESILWAEAKKGSSDLYKSIVQLVLTIGKARTFDKYLPPAFIGAFDGEKIAFIPYNDIHDVFYVNDFNWNVTPSNHESKEFKLIHTKVKGVIDSKALLFEYIKDERELKRFIKDNFVTGRFGISKTRIDKNNFLVIYNKWLQTVMPTIAVNWEIAKKTGIIDGDFYLADLLSQENHTIKEKLFVLLKRDHYELDRFLNEAGFFNTQSTGFTDGQVAHTQFWNKYDRPPKAEYWDYIVERRDLLVPQDVRERKGSFFTPQVWVELSQQYLTDVLGEDWQDEYYVWDCAAGTGNLLTGLTNKYNVWASTLDKQDVEVIHDRIGNGTNLLHEHVFQFDFLNDDFSKLPKPLQEIINNPLKRKKLVVYINPPYAEATNAKTQRSTGENRGKLSSSKIFSRYEEEMSFAGRELFAQFLIRIYKEIPTCMIANFSTLKNLQSSNFSGFRKVYQAKLEKLFLVPADSFDNVKGKFPIGFFIWNTQVTEPFEQINADVYNRNGSFFGTKDILSTPKGQLIIDWLRQHYDKSQERIGYLRLLGTDMQHNKDIFITNSPSENDFKMKLTTNITQNNLIEMCIYLSVRHVFEATWLNDRDQFLYPNEGWKADKDFQNDCLAYALFHSQNKILGKEGTNHWIPFTEQEVNAKTKFESNFMSKYLAGKIEPTKLQDNIFSVLEEPKVKYGSPLVFSPTAAKVFESGKALWKYYHSQKDCNVNASLYDIREYFQGRNDTGKMNTKSTDETYSSLIGELRHKMKQLSEKIEPKVYEYGFYKE